VTDIDDSRLKRASEVFSPEWAAKKGVKLMYVNTGKSADPVKDLMDITEGRGYDDVFVFAPVKPVVEQGDKILGYDGCLNFFAGPSDTAFSASFNFYNVHYNSTHIVGTSGGNTDDMKKCIKMCEEGKLNPAAMVTHIGGLDCAAETTLNLPKIPGGKKLIYTGIKMPLTAISDLLEKGYPELAAICKNNKGLWCDEAEKYLLSHSEKL
jgi:threonine dehydrogenase-like Zn-dependent dehydrogenase